MQLIEWDQKFSVNVSVVDEEHKQLIALTNQLHNAMRTGQGRLILGKILQDLVTYTETHFVHEEQLMASAQYPGLTAHQAAHADLTRQVHELIVKNEAGNLSLSMEVLGFLKSWLINHIQGADKLYSSHLNQYGIS